MGPSGSCGASQRAQRKQRRNHINHDCMGKLYDFYDKIENDYESGELAFENNNDRGHNAMVMLLMLRKSKDIGMFCGSMSVFRNSFYKHIIEKYPEEGAKLKDDMKKALTDYVSAEDTSLKIILENPGTSKIDNLIICKEDFYKKAKMYALKWEDYLPELGHFSFTSDERIVRLENDKEEHDAMIKIGNWDEEEKVGTLFAKMINQSEPYLA